MKFQTKTKKTTITKNEVTVSLFPIHWQLRTPLNKLYSNVTGSLPLVDSDVLCDIFKLCIARGTLKNVILARLMNINLFLSCKFFLKFLKSGKVSRMIDFFDMFDFLSNNRFGFGNKTST